MLSHAELDRFQRDGYLIQRSVVKAASCERMLEIARGDLAGAVPPLELYRPKYKLALSWVVMVNGPDPRPSTALL